MESGLSWRPSRTAKVFDADQVVPPSLTSIAPILHAANEIQYERPRVAYLCRFHVFGRAHKMDPTSGGRGVRQFKSALLHRLMRDNKSSLASRVMKTDAREMENFYYYYYEHHIRALDQQGDQVDRAQLGKACKTAGVLFEVLCAVYKSEKVEEIASEIVAAVNDIEKKNKTCARSSTTLWCWLGRQDGDKKLKDLLQLKHLKAWIQWLFSRQ